jgi:hypothetical protein
MMQLIKTVTILVLFLVNIHKFYLIYSPSVHGNKIYVSVAVANAELRF